MASAGYDSSDTEEEADSVMACFNRHIVSDVSDDRGTFEIEIFESEEGMNTKETMAKCTKNPGHSDFYHIQDFKKRHLLKEYKNRDLYRAITTSAELTVSVICCYVSPNRPDRSSSASGDEYFYADKKGKSFPRSGTGWIWKIEVCGEGKEGTGTFCECEFCIKNPDTEREKKWWKIIVITATHHVFDEQECKKTSIYLWKEKGRDTDKYFNYRVKASSMGDNPLESDRVTFTCATHDEELAKTLIKFCRRRDELISRCNTKFQNGNIQEALTVVVSHPHGEPKRITLGTGIERVDGEVASHFRYNTPTCNGSSGGFVWAVGWGSDLGCVAPHSWGGKNNNNESGSSWPLD